MKVVLGGGSAPVGLDEDSAREIPAVGRPEFFAGEAVFPGKVITAPGQTVAQSGAQVTAQQPISSWPGCICPLAAIGQSGFGTANAGPDVIAKDSASTIRTNRRRMVANLRQARLRDNYDAKLLTLGNNSNPSRAE